MDLRGNNYCVLTIAYNHNREYFDISMPIYSPKLLKIFIHPSPKNQYYRPHKGTVTENGKSTQYAKLTDNAPPLGKKVTKDIQAKVGI